MSHSDLVNGLTVGIESTNADIWKAIVATSLPLLWLDVVSKQNPIHDPVRTPSIEAPA